MKTVCIYHSIDLDGWMSAAIVKHWWMLEQNKLSGQTNFLKGEDCEIATTGVLTFIGFNYGDSIPNLTSYDKIIMCDVSLPKEEMDKIPLKNLIWLDHHISAIKDSESYPYNDSFGTRDTKFAACELTWQYFFPNETMPEIVRLLGRYDCFGHKGTNEEQKVLEFQYGSRQVIYDYRSAYDWLIKTKDEIPTSWGSYIDSNMNLIIDAGKSIYKYLCQDAKQSYKNGFEIIFKQTFDANFPNSVKDKCKFICINKERFNPINFDIDYHKDGYDGAACFYFDGKQYIFSLYNDNDLVDCSAIAKQFGGGGHKGAAGFRVRSLNEIGL